MDALLASLPWLSGGVGLIAALVAGLLASHYKRDMQAAETKTRATEDLLYSTREELAREREYRRELTDRAERLRISTQQMLDYYRGLLREHITPEFAADRLDAAGGIVSKGKPTGTPDGNP